MNWAAFRQWVKNKYAKSYAPNVYGYAQKFSRLLYGNLAELDSFSKCKRGAILRALVALSKYLGVYEQFKQRMASYGIKWESQSSFDSFLRIMRDNNSDVVEWVKKCLSAFDRDYSVFVKFALISGLRKSEAIESFNLIVRLGRAGKLDEYYNAQVESLEHYRYPRTFLRGSKNVFFSFIPRDFINAMAECNTISDSGLKRRRTKLGLPSRINDLRDYYATFMLNHGLLREEIDLLQGRIGKSLFMKHYFSPAIKELKNRTLKATEEILKASQS